MKRGKKELFSFREITNQELLILDHRLPVLLSNQFEYISGDNALLVYGYIDQEAGITFEVLAIASSDLNGKYTHRKGNDNVSYKIRYDEMDGIIIPLEMKDYLYFFDKINHIKENYQADSMVCNLREVRDLDSLRYESHPDDLLIYFYGKKFQNEGIWCRLVDAKNYHFIARLLDEPYQNFGVHQGDLITFRLLNVNGELVAMYEEKI